MGLNMEFCVLNLSIFVVTVRGKVAKMVRKELGFKTPQTTWAKKS